MRSIVVMGVSGCGKTVVGRRIAPLLHMPFHDGDDHHPASNVEKMAAGQPLDDDDRRPWLDRLGRLLASAAADDAPVVLACSALRRAHRQRLRAHADPVFVHLVVPPDVAAARIGGREDHFMPAQLVASQFATLEPPVDGIRIDATGPLEDVIGDVLHELHPDEQQT